MNATLKFVNAYDLSGSQDLHKSDILSIWGGSLEEVAW
jgi:hypothetical protein